MPELLDRTVRVDKPDFFGASVVAAIGDPRILPIPASPMPGYNCARRALSSF
jgi:hypothetical protein